MVKGLESRIRRREGRRKGRDGNNKVTRDGRSSGKGKKRRMRYTAEVWETSIKMLQK